MRTALFALPFLIAAIPASAQRLPPAQQARMQQLGAQLGQCHRGVVLQLARTRLTGPQIVERALANCAAREVPIRQLLVRNLGQPRASASIRPSGNTGASRSAASSSRPGRSARAEPFRPRLPVLRE